MDGTPPRRDHAIRTLPSFCVQTFHHVNTTYITTSTFLKRLNKRPEVCDDGQRQTWKRSWSRCEAWISQTLTVHSNSSSQATNCTTLSQTHERRLSPHSQISSLSVHGEAVTFQQRLANTVAPATALSPRRRRNIKLALWQCCWQ